MMPRWQLVASKPLRPHQAELLLLIDHGRTPLALFTWLSSCFSPLSASWPLPPT